MIDFSKLPVDTLVDCDYGCGYVHTLFNVCAEGSRLIVSDKPALTRTKHDTRIAAKFRISAKNPWLPWFGGDCPVPHNCSVEFINTKKLTVSGLALSFNWEHGCRDFDFSGGIAYRLLESPWQTISGVCDE